MHSFGNHSRGSDCNWIEAVWRGEPHPSLFVKHTAHVGFKGITACGGGCGVGIVNVIDATGCSLLCDPSRRISNQ